MAGECSSHGINEPNLGVCITRRENSSCSFIQWLVKCKSILHDLTVSSIELVLVCLIYFRHATFILMHTFYCLTNGNGCLVGRTRLVMHTTFVLINILTRPSFHQRHYPTRLYWQGVMLDSRGCSEGGETSKASEERTGLASNEGAVAELRVLSEATCNFCFF